MSPGGALDGVDGGAESRGCEEDAEHAATRGGIPLYPGEQRQHALPSEQGHKEDDVDGDQAVGALGAEEAEDAGVVLHVDNQGADQREDEGGEIEDVEEARALEVFEGVARHDEEAAPGGGE